MDISFLIVTRNRPADLRVTLNTLEKNIDLEKHEVCVFIDGCDTTMPLIEEYDWVQWSKVNKSISASPARNALYKMAKGKIFIGLDDDAHPISVHFIEEVTSRFRESVNLGIIAFQEVRGLFTTDQDALKCSNSGLSYITNDFVGCGFAIKKEAYDATNGFPLWMDIYGEESAVAIEVMDAGYDIVFDYNLKVNHRVDVQKRKAMGRNYFRFEHQLRNVLRYYLVYYPKPSRRIIKTLLHNFRKYALSDWIYFKAFWGVLIDSLLNIKSILSYRKPVQEHTIEKKKQLRDLKY
ncbi:glycosyltransferase [uncultured Dokdonia sp.]|uniref:glycosyltransferase family 2 protein n=1 Tax=uncultured Dokdonia sp. TaxID=575653 RepID=UPI0030EF940E|tara:strand:+ start:62203 stop:63081 length:879 start_codon:yes stop_codon:yes gene_type:complete